MANPIWAGIFTKGMKPTIRKNQPGPYYCMTGVGDEVVRITIQDDGSFEVHYGPTDNPDTLLVEGKLDPFARHGNVARRRRRSNRSYKRMRNSDRSAQSVQEGVVRPLDGHPDFDPVADRFEGTGTDS